MKAPTMLWGFQFLSKGIIHSGEICLVGSGDAMADVDALAELDRIAESLDQPRRLLCPSQRYRLPQERPVFGGCLVEVEEVFPGGGVGVSVLAPRDPMVSMIYLELEEAELAACEMMPDILASLGVA